jgi:hypothetical protein
VSRLDDLPPDLHAVLSLVLCRQKSYAEVGDMVGIEEHAVHDRAHAALAMLAPRQARELSAAQREQVGEYLLGQDDPAGGRETRAHLESEAPARAWAQALVAELAPLASRPLPEIPTGGDVGSANAPETTQPQPSATPPAVEPATVQPTPSSGQPFAEPPPASSTAERESPATKEAARSSSRRGGMIVLGVTAAVVIAAVVLIVGVGGSGGSSNPSSTAAASTTPGTASTPGTTSTPAASSTPTTSSTSTSTTGSTTSKSAAGEPRIDATIPLTSPNPSDKALGIVEVISRGNVRAFLVVAEHLPPTAGFRYAAWLYNSPTDALLLGSGPKVSSNGILKAAGGLPANAAHYGTIVLTEEHSERPAQPGSIVLSGTFKVG